MQKYFHGSLLSNGVKFHAEGPANPPAQATFTRRARMNTFTNTPQGDLRVNIISVSSVRVRIPCAVIARLDQKSGVPDFCTYQNDRNRKRRISIGDPVTIENGYRIAQSSHQ
jgi:hypothetical protein